MIFRVPPTLCAGLMLALFASVSYLSAEEVRNLPVIAPSESQPDVVTGNLLTNETSSDAGGWLHCGEGNALQSANQVDLEKGGCAYREFRVMPETSYALTCVAKSADEVYSSVSLTFADEAYTSLAAHSAAVDSAESRAYSIDLDAPAGSSIGAVTLYSEGAASFQDCAVVHNAEGVANKASISGMAWLDANADGRRDANDESSMANVSVQLIQNDTAILQTTTNSEGQYKFISVDLDTPYYVRFIPKDESVEFTTSLNTGSTTDNSDVVDLDAGTTGEIILSYPADFNGTPSELNLDATHIDAGFVSTAVAGQLFDLSVCGTAWLDKDTSGNFDGTDELLKGINVRLHDIERGTWTEVASNDQGQFAFADLAEGSYALEYAASNSLKFVTRSVLADGQPDPEGSYPWDDNGWTDEFVLADSDSSAACTLANANVGYTSVATIEPSYAENDSVTGTVGQLLNVDILANDKLCDNEAESVTILGHNVPGTVAYSDNMLVISDTTAVGEYNVLYAVRGLCGSQATASVTVTITAPVRPLNMCNYTTAHGGGVEFHEHEVTDYPEVLAFYDADDNFLFDSTDPQFVRGPYWKVVHSNRASFGKYMIWLAATRNPALPLNSVRGGAAVYEDGTSAITHCSENYWTPVALDLNGDGKIGVTGLSTARDAYRPVQGRLVQFDTNGNGELETIEWFAGDGDGILVDNRDKNAASQMSGKRLFGSQDGQFEHGYQQLALLDINADGQLDNNELTGLELWIDDGDAVVDAGELHSLSQQRISTIMTHMTMTRDGLMRSTALKNDGSVMMTEDVWLATVPKTYALIEATGQ